MLNFILLVDALRVLFNLFAKIISFLVVFAFRGCFFWGGVVFCRFFVVCRPNKQGKLCVSCWFFVFSHKFVN